MIFLFILPTNQFRPKVLPTFTRSPDFKRSSQSRAESLQLRTRSRIERTGMCVLFSSHSFWTSSSLDLPAGVTQEEGHTGFFIHLPSAVRALFFFARRIQPFLSLVDRTNDLIVLHSLGIFIFILFFSERNPVYRGSNSRPNVSEGYEVTSELPGRPPTAVVIFFTLTVF